LSNISNTKYGNIKIRPDTGDRLIKINNLDIQSCVNTFNLLPGSTPGHRLAKLISSLSFQERFHEEIDLPGKFTLKKKNESIYDLDIIWTDTRRIIRPDKLEIKEIKKGVFYLCQLSRSISGIV
jgi:hypothetical protein